MRTTVAFGRLFFRRKTHSVLVVAALLSAGATVGINRIESASAAGTTLASVLASSGANLDTDYPIPSGAIFVSPTGTDSGNGSISSPLATFGAAINKAPSGGTIVLRGGTYRQSAPNISKKLTVQAYPHERPVVSGADVVSAWAQEGTAWRATSWTSPFCQNCYRQVEINPSYPAAGQVEQVFRNGTPLRQVGSLSQVGAGKFYVDKSSKRLYVGDNPTTGTIEVSSRSQAFYFGESAGGSAFKGIHITKFSPPHEDAKAMVLFVAPDMLIEHSRFDHSSGSGVGLFNSPRMHVNHVTVTDTGAEAMGLGRTDSALVENSQFNRSNTEKFNVIPDDCEWACTIAGIKSTRADGLKILNNAFVDNDSSGFWCDLSCTNATLTGNAITGSTIDGIFYEISSRATITNNYIEKSGHGIKVAGSDHVNISNNTLVNNNIQLGIYDDPRIPGEFDPGYAPGLRLSWNTTNTVVVNNVLTAGSTTKWTLNTISTNQVAAPQMFDIARDNSVSGNQVFVWAKGSGGTSVFNSLTAFAQGTGLAFGSFGSGPPPTVTTPDPTTTTAKPTTTVKPTSTTVERTTTSTTTPEPEPTTSVVPTTSTTTHATTPPQPIPTTSQTPPPSPVPNLLRNPGFEDSVLLWDKFGGANLQVVPEAHSGKSALRVSAGTQRVWVNGAVSRPVPVPSIDVTQKYTGSCYVKSSSQINIRVRFQEYSQGWNRLERPTNSRSVRTLNPNSWYRVTVTAMPRHAGAQLPFVVFSDDLRAGGATFLVDDCQVIASAR